MIACAATEACAATKACAYTFKLFVDKIEFSVVEAPLTISIDTSSGMHFWKEKLGLEEKNKIFRFFFFFE